MDLIMNFHYLPEKWDIMPFIFAYVTGAFRFLTIFDLLCLAHDQRKDCLELQYLESLPGTGLLSCTLIQPILVQGSPAIFC